MTREIIDLSHILEPGMPSYPGLPVPQFKTWFTHAESAERQLYAPGTTFQIVSYNLGGNTGTYLDAPFHRHPDGEDMATLSLDKMADLSGTLITIDTGSDGGPIDADVFQGLELKDKAILINTGWSEHWGDSGYFRSGPFLTAAACRFLEHAQVKLVGIDCANIDNMGDPERPAHTILLGARIPVVEHLTELAKLKGKAFRFFAVPPAIKGCTTFTVRAFALVEVI